MGESLSISDDRRRAEALTRDFDPSTACRIHAFHADPPAGNDPRGACDPVLRRVTGVTQRPSRPLARVAFGRLLRRMDWSDLERSGAMS